MPMGPGPHKDGRFVIQLRKKWEDTGTKPGFVVKNLEIPDAVF